MNAQRAFGGEEPKTESNESAGLPVQSSTAAEPRRRRGFAAMDAAKVRAIARRGGVAAHQRGTAHRFTADEARAAGQKGGLAPHRTRGRKAALSATASAANDASGPA